jgi:hypothetical protein
MSEKRGALAKMCSGAQCHVPALARAAIRGRARDSTSCTSRKAPLRWQKKTRFLPGSGLFCDFLALQSSRASRRPRLHGLFALYFSLFATALAYLRHRVAARDATSCRRAQGDTRTTRKPILLFLLFGLLLSFR